MRCGAAPSREAAFARPSRGTAPTHPTLDPSGGDANAPRSPCPQLVAVLCFFTSIGYVSLNETARELEMPFGLDPNDLNLTEYQRDFNHKLAQLLDQTVRRPESRALTSGRGPIESTRRRPLARAGRGV